MIIELQKTREVLKPMPKSLLIPESLEALCSDETLNGDKYKSLVTWLAFSRDSLRIYGLLWPS